MKSRQFSIITEEKKIRLIRYIFQFFLLFFFFETKQKKLKKERKKNVYLDTAIPDFLILRWKKNMKTFFLGLKSGQRKPFFSLVIVIGKKPYQHRFQDIFQGGTKKGHLFLGWLFVCLEGEGDIRTFNPIVSTSPISPVSPKICVGMLNRLDDVILLSFCWNTHTYHAVLDWRLHSRTVKDFWDKGLWYVPQVGNQKTKTKQKKIASKFATNHQ